MYLWNHLSRSRNGMTMIKLFTGLKDDSSDLTLSNLRVWGCPSWILDPRLQDGHKLPKFSRRSRCGMYLGSSSKHADTIGRILNLQTGHVSPQFHVIYDERFSTAVGTINRDTILDQEMWDGLLEYDGYSDYLDPEDYQHEEVPSILTDNYDTFSNDLDPNAPVPVPEGDDTFSPKIANDATSTSNIEGDQATEGDYVTRYGRKVRQYSDPIYAQFVSPTSESRHADHTDSHRHFQYVAGGVPNRKIRCDELNNEFLHGKLDWNPDTFLRGNSIDTKQILLQLLKNQPDGEWHPQALAAKSNSKDTYTWAEARASPHWKGFLEAAHVEIQTLLKMGVWDVVE